MLLHGGNGCKLWRQVIIGPHGLWLPAIGDHPASPEPCAEAHRQAPAPQRRGKGGAAIVQKRVQQGQPQRNCTAAQYPAQQETAPCRSIHQHQPVSFDLRTVATRLSGARRGMA